MNEGHVTCLLPAFDNWRLSKGILEYVRAFAVVWVFFFTLLCSKIYSGICASLCSLGFVCLFFLRWPSLLAWKAGINQGWQGTKGENLMISLPKSNLNVLVKKRQKLVVVRQELWDSSFLLINDRIEDTSYSSFHTQY